MEQRPECPPKTSLSGHSRDSDGAPLWHSSGRPIPYPEAIETMQAWAHAVADSTAPERVWLLEHPRLYTAGTSARPEHLLDARRLPVFKSGRGGEFTYHGPGQRIVYLVLDLRRRYAGDVRAYVHALQTWVIAALANLDVVGHARADEIGVWVTGGDEGADQVARKIASIGIRVSRGVAFHGIAINFDPDLDDYAGIVACGGAGDQPTSLTALGSPATLSDLDKALRQTFHDSVLKPAPRQSPHLTARVSSVTSPVSR